MKISKLIYLMLFCGFMGCSESSGEQAPEGMVYFAGGRVTIGSNEGGMNEYPEHKASVNAFYLDSKPVTVREFREFVEATGYETQAEKFENSAVFDIKIGQWKLVKGANWKRPLSKNGPKAKPDHPVTQVSWNDAKAYCQWAGRRLPTEEEWEYAARNGGRTSDDRYSWGNQLVSDEGYQANVWQGHFPESVRVEDGYLYTSPVGSFGKTKAGLSDMGGNVWEWVATTYRLYEGNPKDVEKNENRKVIRGGSFLCDSTVCHGYRVSARSFNTSESATFHMGFRTAKSID